MLLDRDYIYNEYTLESFPANTPLNSKLRQFIRDTGTDTDELIIINNLYYLFVNVLLFEKPENSIDYYSCYIKYEKDIDIVFSMLYVIICQDDAIKKDKQEFLIKLKERLEISEHEIRDECLKFMIRNAGNHYPINFEPKRFDFETIDYEDWGATTNYYDMESVIAIIRQGINKREQIKILEILEKRSHTLLISYQVNFQPIREMINRGEIGCPLRILMCKKGKIGYKKQMDVVKKRLTPFLGYNSDNKRIMTNNDYRLLIKLVGSLISKQKVPVLDKKLHVEWPEDRIRYTFYGVYYDFGKKLKIKKPTRDNWINFLKNVFDNFNDCELETIKSHFSDVPHK